jgi:hypothetical protein
VALERLVPKAVRVLEEHLDSERPDRWRSALRVLEHSWGRPPEHVVPAALDADDDLNFESMPTAQLIALVREQRQARAAAEQRQPDAGAEGDGSNSASDTPSASDSDGSG